MIEKSVLLDPDESTFGAHKAYPFDDDSAANAAKAARELQVFEDFRSRCGLPIDRQGGDPAGLTIQSSFFSTQTVEPCSRQT